ncbi:MAG: DUF4326 domain-containing protein [Syntrophorhabdaceae bacterium]|nr:DUF4326 domain-containing protein [Syntrophorhabdaceae bacterium]
MADDMKNNESFLPGFEKPPPRIVHWKKAKYDIYIGRPGPFGNPFVVGKDGTRDEVIEKYEEYVRSSPDLMEKIRKEIPGKVLGCWCAPRRCHGEVLIKIADEGLALEKNQQVKGAELTKTFHEIEEKEAALKTREKQPDGISTPGFETSGPAA